MQDNIKQELRRIFTSWEHEKADPVRIGLLGQPGAGKSSLINSLIGSEQATVGVQTDRTRDVEEFHWQGMALVDLPGYGTQRFPDATFFDRFGILNFDALLCVANGKFRDEDSRFFKAVVDAGKSALFVRTNLDSLKQRGKSEQQLREDVHHDLAGKLHSDAFRLFFVDNISGRGINDLASAIAEVVPPARRAQFLRWAAGRSDEFLQGKRDSVDPMIRWFAAGSAANALNPIPGAGVAVDLGIVVKMQDAILTSFGFTKEILQDYMSKYQFLTSFIGPLLNSLGREAVALFVGRFVGKEIARYIPILGPLLSSAAGATLVYLAGQEIADRCLDVARRVRDAEMAAAAA
ncbi:GTPase [Belnapia moabensis]|uniref:GTPase n=1 Tax=Belnapia moabensis TaxID=365533 RepID=UPI000A054A4F|nr:GTPase [Belnapia moabensis]